MTFHERAPRRLRRLVQAGLVAAGCTVPAAMARPAPDPPEVLAEDRLLLFAVQVGPRMLRDALPGYADGAEGYRIPLGGLGRALGLGLQVTGLRAEGQVRGQPFRLDLPAGTAQVGDRKLPVDRAQVEALDGDLYVAPELLAAWLDVHLHLDTGRALVEVTSSWELPIQHRWALDQRAAELAGRKPGPAAEPLPRVETPYALWDPPFINQTLEGTWNRGQGALQGSTYLAGDLLRMTSTFYFTSGPGQLLGNGRATLARRDAQGDLLGPLRATAVEAGDIYVPPLALVGAGPSGRGFQVGNGTDRWQGGEQTFTFRGDLLPGWVVELYQEGILAGFQRARADGLYLFPDVPLRFGVNTFRLVFHGPEGQVREETRRLDIRQPLLAPGEVRYNAAATWTGLPGYQAEVAYGLHPQLDVGVALAQVPRAPGQPDLQRFGSVSVQGFLPGWSATGTLARDLAGGTAASGTLNTGWGDTSASLQHTRLDGFSSPEFRSSFGAIRSRNRGLLNLPLPRRLPIPVVVTLEGQRDDLASGGLRSRVAGQVAAQVRGWSLSNQLALDHGGGVTDRSGTFRAGTSWSGLALRGEAGYGLGGGPSLRTLALQGDASAGVWTVQGAVQRLLAAGENQVGVQVNRREGRMALTFRVEHAPSTRLTVAAGLHISLGWEPRTRRYLPSAAAMAQGGAVSARPYVDRPDQPGLEGASLGVDGHVRPSLEAPGGVLFLPHLGWGREVGVGLNASGIEDPFLTSRSTGFRITPRPGKTVLLDFPMVVSGEVNGTACLRTARGSAPLAGLEVELVDAGGRVQREAVSAYDGFFELAGLLPGTYVLRVAEREAERLGVALPQPRSVTLTADDPCREGLTLCVVAPDPEPLPDPPPEPPAAAVPQPPAAVPSGPPAVRRVLRRPPRPPRPVPAPRPPAPAAARAGPDPRGGILVPSLAVPYGFFSFHWIYRLRGGAS